MAARRLCEAAYLAGCDGARSTVRETIGHGLSRRNLSAALLRRRRRGRRPADRTANSTSISTRPISWPSFPRRAGARAPDRHRARRAGRPRRDADIRGCQRRAIEHLQGSGRQGELVLDLSRASPGGGSFPQGPRLPARRRRAHPQPGRRPGHEHRHRRRRQPGLEARRRCLRGRAPRQLLDSYEPERIGFARRLVATTDRVFSFVDRRGPHRRSAAHAPRAVRHSAARSFESAREWMFRTVSQIMINYRGCALSEGSAGDVHGGDRLPWARSRDDNLRTLSVMSWQVHVYGAASGALAAWCRDRDIPLNRFDWHESMRPRVWRATRSICCGPTPMWRSPIGRAHPGGSRATSPSAVTGSGSDLTRANALLPHEILNGIIQKEQPRL